MEYIDQRGELVSISSADEKWLNDEYFALQMLELPADAPKAAASYRVSSKGQVDHDDIPMQKIECRKYCIQNGWRLVVEKFEKGVSGSKVSAAKRDAIQELKAMAEKKEFEVMVVFMFDRLGRIDEETPFLLQWFVQHGVRMFSTREGEQRLDSHTDKLTNYIRFWQASGESEKIAERVRSRLVQLNSSGHYTGGQCAFGYQAVNKGRKNKKDQEVKDLEINPVEAPLVRELFEKTVYDGSSSYALAQMLNNRGIKTHSGAKFQSNHILRILRHEGYTGYIITKNARSDYIPELELIDVELFKAANQRVDARCSANAAARKTAHDCENPTLLAGIVYCGCCGARMSGFMHHDRYKKSDGTVVENIKPKYQCFQRAQKLRECTGQSLYLADRVDGIVLAIARELFSQIQTMPRDRTIEARLRQESAEKRRCKKKAEKKVADCRHAVNRYEDEVLKCLDGHSDFDSGTLSALLRKSKVELKQAELEYAAAANNMADEREAIRQIDTYYNRFIGWADEFEEATLERKRVILGQLFDRIEVSSGYNIDVHVNMSYRQFVMLQNEESDQKSAC